jgi:RNA polymerase sigma-70 factor, ECF subfamily
MLQRDARIPNEDEAGLVHSAKGGDIGAFEELIRRYYGKYKRLATSILRDAAEAEDVIQSSCFRAYRQLHQFKGESTFATWLGRIVVNQARTVRTCRHRRNTVSIDETILVRDQVAWPMAKSQQNPEQQLGADEVRLLVLREINYIPAIFRTVLILRDLREIPVADIAAQLKLRPQTIKTRLFRGRKELRSRMLEHCGEHAQIFFTN